MKKTISGLPPFEFENWAVIALGGIPNKTQVGDMGIDGRIFPVSALENRRKAKTDELQLEEKFYPIQVKQKDKAGRPDIDSFEAMLAREECAKGFFVSFDLLRRRADRDRPRHRPPDRARNPRRANRPQTRVGAACRA